MSTTLADAITAHLDELSEHAQTQFQEDEVEGYRGWLDSGWDLVRLALDLELDPQLPCYVARAEGSSPCGPFDTVSEANAFIGHDDRYDVEQITIGDAARMFASCRAGVQAPPTPLVALLTLPTRLVTIAEPEGPITMNGAEYIRTGFVDLPGDHGWQPVAGGPMVMWSDLIANPTAVIKETEPTPAAAALMENIELKRLLSRLVYTVTGSYSYIEPAGEQVDAAIKQLDAAASALDDFAAVGA